MWVGRFDVTDYADGEVYEVDLDDPTDQPMRCRTCGTVGTIDDGINLGGECAHDECDGTIIIDRPPAPEVDPEDVIFDLLVADGFTSTSQQLVTEFHEVFDLPRSNTPTTDIPARLTQLRNDLLREEARELIDACDAGDLIKIADGIADVLYVVYGTAVTYGLDADALLREVHRSNMSKLDEHGNPVRRDDGKILKGANYSPPQLDRVIWSAR